MRRVDRRRLERIRRRTVTIGLSFTIGALTAVGLMWRNDGGRSERTGPTSERTGPAVEPRAIDIPTTEPVIAPDTTPTATIGPAIETLVAPRDRDLAMPVDGVEPDDLRDTFSEARGGSVHEALDIMAPRGSRVLAAAPGRIERLFRSDAGGNTIYVRSNDRRTIYYYAHLDAYARGLEEGDSVRRGETLGTVGSSGNASEDAPHLHFAILRTVPDADWWEPATAINPYPLLVGED
jgi:murein DD-endopeptidase MepM/ murein hydrolase activator NlpD